MLKVLITLLLSLFHFLGQSQNIIPNGDFEDVNICKAYQEDCFPTAWKSTTIKLAKYNVSNAEAGSDDQRSISLLYLDRARNFDRKFIQTYLLCPMKAGEEYSLRFDYRAILPRAKSIGFYFADSLLFDASNLKLENLEAHEVALLNDHLKEWKKYTSTFTATKNAKVLIVGNFRSDKISAQFDLSKKEQKKLDKSYEPKNRIWMELDNLELIPSSTISDCDRKAMKEKIYSDKVRHSFFLPKNMEAQATDKDSLVQISQPSDSVEEKEKIKTVPLKFEIGINQLKGVEFESGTTTLIQASIQKLEEMVQYLKKNKLVRLKILGHTDNVGSEIENQILSEERANRIRLFLIEKGVESHRLNSKGMGEHDPIATNNTEDGRQQNRRVEVEVYY